MSKYIRRQRDKSIIRLRNNIILYFIHNIFSLFSLCLTSNSSKNQRHTEIYIVDKTGVAPHHAHIIIVLLYILLKYSIIYIVYYYMV